MIEYGSLWEEGNVFVQRVEIVFSPYRWMGTLTYTGKPYVVDGHVYILKMEDGESAEIEVYAPGRKWNAGVITTVAPFNPVLGRP